MDSFSIGGAWSFGLRFFAHRRALQILVLIGIGLVAPVLLQFAFFGQTLGRNPTLMGPGETAAAGGAAATIVLIVSYMLQLASYFTSWRLGFALAQPPAAAIGFGLLASLLAFGIFAVLGTPALFAVGASLASGIPFLGLLVGLILLAFVVAIFYTLVAALIAVLASIVLVLSMLFGAITGNVGMAATLLGGGSGAVVVLFLVMSAVLLWLTTRFSCTTSLMADWKSYNVIAAMRESWRLTLEDQWPILRYLALVAFGLGIVVVGISAVAGIGAAAFLQGSPGPAGQLVTIVLQLALGIPVAFLTVLVPAGIYRELTRSTLAAEVFA